MIELACVDGDFDDNEKEFLLQSGQRWGLSLSQAKAVLKNPGKVKFCPPEDPEQRIAQLYDLIIMMLADGVIMEVEMDYVQMLAVRMGFRASDVPKMLEAIIQSAREAAKPDIDATEFLET